MLRSVISFHNWVGRAELCSLRHGGLGCAGCHPQDSAELTTSSYLMPALVTGRQRTTLCCSEYLPERLHFRIKSVLSAWIWMYRNFSGPRYQYCVAFPKAPPCFWLIGHEIEKTGSLSLISWFDDLTTRETQIKRWRFSCLLNLSWSAWCLLAI